MANKNKTTKSSKKEVLISCLVVAVIALICAGLIFLVVKFYDVEHHDDEGSTSSGTGSTDKADSDTFKYTTYDSAEKVQTEGVYYNSAYTGMGVNVDVEKVADQIDAFEYSDFAKTDKTTDFVGIRVQGMGDIVVALRPDIAPVTVENFKKLVSQKFYTNTVFDRIMNFMIEGGGASKTGEAKQTEAIKGEFTQNGYVNKLLHIPGVISMGRSSDRNSASCEFFIMSKETKDLDGLYASFGYVVAGYDIVEKIAAVEVKSPDNSSGSAPKAQIVIKEAFFLEPKAKQGLATDEKAADTRKEFKVTIKNPAGEGVGNIRFDVINVSNGKTIVANAMTNTSGEAVFNVNPASFRVIVTYKKDLVFEEYYNFPAGSNELSITAQAAE